MRKPEGELRIDQYEQLKGGKTNFESYWQILKDYFYVEAADVNRSYSEGNELDFTYLWDSNTLEAADVLASGFMSYLTPPSSKWFKLRTSNRAVMEDKKVASYLEAIEEELYHVFNKSNFYNQMFPAYKQSGVYGTSVVYVEEDIDDGLRFYTVPIKNVCIAEDGKERVREFFIEYEFTSQQAIEKFGESNLPYEITQDKDNRKQDKHKFILYIGPRYGRDASKANKENMPYKVLWIEHSKKKIVQEGGYLELPGMAHRFYKQPNIVWGFSPAMKALPDARLLNAEAKTNLRAMMKHTDPPMAVPSNAFLRPFNANPRALNYYDPSIMNDPRMMMPFANNGNPQIGMMAMQYSVQRIKALMFNDVFLTFSGLDKQMNNPEVYERINEKMTLLGPSVGRFLSDVLQPIITRSINILARMGRLPEPPDEMLDDPRYEIEYVSRLAQAQKHTELQTLTTALGVAGNMAQIMPTVLDKIDADKVIDNVWGITGAPVSTLRDDKEVNEVRQARAEQEAQLMQMQQAQETAGVIKTASEADKNMRGE